MASSGSLKELARAVNAFLVVPAPRLPLPDDLQAVIDAYLHKHEKYDDAASTRLHDEFVSIFQRLVRDAPTRLGPFVAILRRLLPCLRTTARVFQWWDLLTEPVLANEDQDRHLAEESFAGVFEVLMSFDADDEDANGLETPSNPFVNRLVALWMDRYNLLEQETVSRSDENRDRRIREVMMKYGKSRPKEFMLSLNNFFTKRVFRKSTLRLLCEFVQSQPPHLYLVVQTPLFANLMRCLQEDTSTTVVSLALTTLIMLLPHMPSSLVPHLPTLFNIYARLLFWDQERAGTIEAPGQVGDQRASPSPLGWEVCAYSPEYDDVTVPHLLNYYTVLYGLYPINFMDYIRKPQRYLRHANAPSADEIEVQPTEIRHKSERFRRCHLLHPNFYTLTIDSEKTDFGRWIKSEPSEVVAECAALCSAVEFGVGAPQRPLPMPGVTNRPAREVSEKDATEPALLSSSITGSVVDGWQFSRDAGTPGGSRAPSTLLRQSSPSSQPSNRDSLETRYKEAGGDSPTLPPHLVPSPSHPQLQDLINSNKAIKSGIHQSLANDSVPSLSLSHHESIPDRTSIGAPPAPQTVKSPVSLSETSSQLAHLQRQILLLQNDLSFERYLKLQHVAHIGEMRRRQVREAATEAETQNLVIANRHLKNRLEDAKSAEMRARREGKKRQIMAKKWEADFSTKLKTLRDESKRSKAEEQALRRELDGTKLECEKLKKLLCAAEVKELNAHQSMQAIDINTAEIDRLKAEVDRLAVSDRDNQAKEMERKVVLQSAAEAESEREILHMRLSAREMELQRTKKLYQAQITALNSRLIAAQEETPRTRRAGGDAEARAALESALAASRARQAEMKKQHDLMVRKYTALQSSLLEMRSAPTLPPSLGKSMHADGSEYRMSRSVSPADARRGPGQHRLFTDVEALEATSFNVTPPLEALAGSLGSGSSRTATPTSGPGGPSQRPSTPPNAGEGGSGGGNSPEQRYFGRGGVQNRIRKEGKEVEKKKGSLRSIRGFP